MMLSEQISFGGRRVAGFHLVGIAQVPGDPGDVPLVEILITVQVDFSSDRPVTPQEFFALVGTVQEELVPAESTVSFMPLTESTFRGVFKIPSSLLAPGYTIGEIIPVGNTAEVQGVKFTITGVKVLDRAAAPPPAPGDVPLAYLPGTTWTIEFVSDTPVTPQQFFAFTNEVSQRIPVEIISSRPIDPSHFAVTIRPTEAMEPGDVWMDIPLPGVLYQTLRAYSGSYRAPDAPVPAPANGLAPVPTPTPAPAPIEEEKKKKKISTAAIVVIGVAVVAVGGGAVYAATRKNKKKKRRRRAA